MTQGSTWCMKKALEALKDYDAKSATDYIQMALMWQARGQ